jgi:hypothetical protein
VLALSGPGERGLRDAARHLGGVLPHGGSLPEAEWQSRQRALRWLLWAHVVAIPIITLLFDQGLDQAPVVAAEDPDAGPGAGERQGLGEGVSAGVEFGEGQGAGFVDERGLAGLADRGGLGQAGQAGAPDA